mmetsp:Transcript_77989/g.225565  ORF Transcript_77989/g.225565 Transcript_77989/m.225565 type:complete len:288 (-) Transcript_77989:1380-2243(-)
MRELADEEIVDGLAAGQVERQLTQIAQLRGEFPRQRQQALMREQWTEAQVEGQHPQRLRGQAPRDGSDAVVRQRRLAVVQLQIQFLKLVKARDAEVANNFIRDVAVEGKVQREACDQLPLQVRQDRGDPLVGDPLAAIAVQVKFAEILEALESLAQLDQALVIDLLALDATKAEALQATRLREAFGQGLERKARQLDAEREVQVDRPHGAGDAPRQVGDMAILEFRAIVEGKLQTRQLVSDQRFVVDSHVLAGLQRDAPRGGGDARMEVAVQLPVGVVLRRWRRVQL